MLLLLLLQAEPAAAKPDIELGIQLRARSVTIEKKGAASLWVRGERPGNSVDVSVEPKAEGRTELRNVRVDIHAAASVEQGVKIETSAETGTPQ